MDWDKIIDMVVELIKSCIDQENEEQVFSRLRNGGPRVRFGCRSVLRKSGLRGRKLRESTRDMMADLKDATDEEIRDLINQCKDC